MRIGYKFILTVIFIFPCMGSEEFSQIVNSEKSDLLLTSIDNQTISCVRLNYNSNDDKKTAKVIKYINDKGEFFLSEDQNVEDSLERINQKLKKDERIFKLQTGFTMGASSLIVYLQRKHLLTVIKAALSMAGKSGTLISNRIISGSVAGVSLTALSAFTLTYFYKSELSDGTLLTHYMNNLDIFFNLPKDTQIDFIINCHAFDQRKARCVQFEQTIIALDQFMEAAITENIEKNNYDTLMEEINKE